MEALSLSSLALLAVSFLWSPTASAGPALAPLLTAAATAALIATGPGTLVGRRILGHPALVWLGLISYPLYLWHWPLLSFPYIVLGEVPSAVWRILTLALAVLLGALTYHLVEQPIRSTWSTRKAVIILTIGSVILASASVTAGALLPLTRGERERAVDQQLSGPFWRHTRNDVCEHSYGTDYKDFCVKSRAGEPTVVLFGTSFANHFYAGLLDHPQSRGEVIVSFGSCEPSGIYPGSTGDCAAQEALLDRNPAARLALVGSAWPRFGPDGRMVDNVSGEPMGDPAYPDAPAYYGALTERLRRIARPGLRIVVMGPKPELDYDAALCFGRPLRPRSRSCQVSVVEAKLQTDAIYVELRRVVDQIDGALLFDQRPMLCTLEVCRFMTREGMPLLRDNGHYSEVGSRRVIGRLFRIHPNLLAPAVSP